MTSVEKKQFIIQNLKNRFGGIMATTVLKAIENGEDTQLLRELKDQVKDAPVSAKNFLGEDIYQMIQSY